MLRRYEQYWTASTGFRGRYMTLPFPVPDSRFRKIRHVMPDDEGIHQTTREGLIGCNQSAKVAPSPTAPRPIRPTATPEIVVATREPAELSSRPEIAIQLAGFGHARTDKAHMPEAPVPAARRALVAADRRIDQIAAIKSHNPFALNDIVFARETGADLAGMNNNGCSLVWGHPQGPTGLRAIIELIEELADRGGGYGLFHGCAAGNSAMAVVIEVDDGG